MLGGGTPRVVVTSAPVIQPDGTPPPETSGSTTDRSPIAERWGGWYVTGRTGKQKHLGNLPLDDPRRLPPGPLASAPRNLQSLAKLFDTSTYLRDTSDVVALMVLEHQTNVQNLMTRATLQGAHLARPRQWRGTRAAALAGSAGGAAEEVRPAGRAARAGAADGGRGGPRGTDGEQLRLRCVVPEAGAARRAGPQPARPRPQHGRCSAIR